MLTALLIERIDASLRNSRMNGSHNGSYQIVHRKRDLIVTQANVSEEMVQVHLLRFMYLFIWWLAILQYMVSEKLYDILYVFC